MRVSHFLLGEPFSFGLCAFECFVIQKGHVGVKLYCGGGAGCCSKERCVIMQHVCRWRWTQAHSCRCHCPCFMKLSQMEGFLLWLFIQVNVSVAAMTVGYLLRAQDHKCVCELHDVKFKNSHSTWGKRSCFLPTNLTLYISHYMFALLYREVMHASNRCSGAILTSIAHIDFTQLWPCITVTACGKAVNFDAWWSCMLIIAKLRIARNIYLTCEKDYNKRSHW